MSATLPPGSDSLATLRSYPSSKSTFSVSERDQWNRTGNGWWVREDFQIVRRGEKDDLDDWHGPFSEAEARVNAEAWNTRVTEQRIAEAARTRALFDQRRLEAEVEAAVAPLARSSEVAAIRVLQGVA